MLEPAPNFEINFKSVNHFNKRSAIPPCNPVLMAKSDLEMGLLFKFPIFFSPFGNYISLQYVQIQYK